MTRDSTQDLAADPTNTTLKASEPTAMKPGAHHYATSTSSLMFEGSIFAVRQDSVVMSGGDHVVRDVVEHYGAVAICALNTDGEIVMVNQYRHAVGRRLWELPAGLLDGPSAESASAAAARELREEVGIAAREWAVLVDVMSSPGFCDEAIRVYLATDLSDVEQPQLSDEEADMTVQWWNLDRAVAAVFAGEIVNATSVAGVLAASRYSQGGVTVRSAAADFQDAPMSFRDRKRRHD